MQSSSFCYVCDSESEFMSSAVKWWIQLIAVSTARVNGYEHPTSIWNIEVAQWEWEVARYRSKASSAWTYPKGRKRESSSGSGKNCFLRILYGQRDTKLSYISSDTNETTSTSSTSSKISYMPFQLRRQVERPSLQPTWDSGQAAVG